MPKHLFVDLKAGPVQAQSDVTDEDLKIINSLNKNGPITKLTKDDIITRSMICIGEEPTSKMSIHPNGELNGKKVLTLDKIASLMPGAPMMEGHVKEKVPWGRCFKAEVINSMPGYKGAAVQQFYYFVKDDEGIARQKRIDAGILAESSISYFFEKALCSICHGEMGCMGFLRTLTDRKSKPCPHMLGKKDDPSGQVCYWYPHNIQMIGETSFVFRGAYGKTKSMLQVGYDVALEANYSPDEIEGAKELDECLNLYRDSEPEEGTAAAQTHTDGTSQDDQGEQNQGPESNNQNTETESPKPSELAGNEPGNNPGGTLPPGSENLIPPIPDNNSGIIPDIGQNNPKSELSPEAEETPAAKEQAAEILSEKERKDIAALKEDQTLTPEERNDAILDIVGGCEEKYERGVVYYNEPAVVKQETKYACSVCGYIGALCEAGCDMCGGPTEKTENALREYVVLNECPECYTSNPGDDIVCQLCGGALIKSELAQVFKPITPVKPAKSGSVNNEYFRKEDLKNLPDGEYYIEPKYDGIWIQAHKSGEKVMLFTDEGNDVTEKFPGIVNELKAMSADKFILLGEMVKYRGRQRLTHEDVSAWIHSKQESYDDKAFRMKPFTFAVVNGQDVTANSFQARRKILKKNAPWGKQIHLTQGKWISHKNGNERIIGVVDDRATREGVMITGADAAYNKAGARQTYKWKRQFVVDCIVLEVTKKDGGGFIYTCGVGSEKERVTIGKTYATKIEAAVGEIISVSVDKIVQDGEKYSWHVPKVLGKHSGKKAPDPISVIKKIAVEKGAGENAAEGVVMLGQVVPRLLAVPHTYEMWLSGGLVEHGASGNDIDIVTKTELTEAEKAGIREALGEQLWALVDFIVDAEGPAGPNVKLEACMTAENLAAWKYAGKFVIQEHGWGKKAHYDIRFGAPKTARMWGFTCFSRPTTEAGGKKVRCQEKKYHDPKWMEIDKKSIKEGEDGHPGRETTKGDAYMVKIDGGKYDFVRRKPGFVEIVLHGGVFKGRYVFREIDVKSKEMGFVKNIDEDKPKSEKIWVMWKTKEQETSTPVKKLNISFTNGQLVMYESGEIDNEIENAEAVPIED